MPNTTTTPIGRQGLAYPDYDFVGGTTLYSLVKDMHTKISNQLNIHWTGALTLPNTSTISVNHNLATPLASLKVTVLEAGVVLTEAQKTAGYTITQIDSNTVSVQNISGASKTFEMYFGIRVNVLNAETTATSLNTAGAIPLRDSAGRFAVSGINVGTNTNVGDGYIQIANQTTAPAGVAGQVRVWAGASATSLITTLPSGFFGQLNYGIITASRNYDLPDANGLITLTDAAQTLSNKTIDGDLNTIVDLGIGTLKTNAAKPYSAVMRNSSGVPNESTDLTSAIMLPKGTVAQRPANAAGLIRYNSDLGMFEGNTGSFWKAFTEKNYVSNFTDTALAALKTSWTTAKNHERIVICVGDSHGWGQGGQDYDGFFTDMNPHSPYPEVLGFFAKIKNHLKTQRGFDDSIFRPTPYSTGTTVQTTSSEFIAKNTSGGMNWKGVNIISGRFDILSGSAITPVSGSGFFNASAVSDSYAPLIYRERVFRKFGSEKICMAPNIFYRTDLNTLRQHGVLNVIPDLSVTAQGGTWTAYNNNGAIYGEYNTSTNACNVYTRERSLPYWVAVGAWLYIPGYGTVKISAIVRNTNGTTISLIDTDDTNLNNSPFGSIFPGAMLYSGDIAAFTGFSHDMEYAARTLYIGADRNTNGGKLGVYFSDQASAATVPKTSDSLSRSSVFHTTPSGFPKVYTVTNGVDTELVDGTVSVAGGKIIIDTYRATARVGEVYKIDFGARQRGRIFFTYEGKNASAVDDANMQSPIVQMYGFTFNLDLVENWSMGYHTVGAWLGLVASGYAETRDHVGDIQTYTPYTPRLAIIQAPIVNEYLAQTPIATFKTNLNTLITRLNATKNAGNAYRMDTVIFVTLGTKEIDFSGAASSAITYDQYVAAVKEVAGSGVVYIDFRQMFKDMVTEGKISVELLYQDSTHPSAVANQIMGKILSDVTDMIL